jgi:2-polyprenyl-3-methyl-5-hydroxy-6-metoxy-1,4-benzoquinol methylase
MTLDLSKSSVFDYSGLASLSHLRSSECEVLFSLLERAQAVFNKDSTRFSSADYKWPRDPLHTWSRCWEYPYVYHHITKWRASWVGRSAPKIVDVGSGVTFFPFTVAKLGCEVSCTDIDPVCDKELNALSSVLSCAPGHLNFRLTDSDKLPYVDSEVDAVYCISVLEHIPCFERTIEEIARILKPGGALFLTIDLDLRGDCEIGAERYRLLKTVLEKQFEYIFPACTVHPSELLTSLNGPYPVHEVRGLHRALFLIKQEIKHFLGRRRAPLSHFYLCVEGMTMSLKL